MAVFSQHGTRVFLCLFDDATGAETQLALPHREGAVHFGYVPGLRDGQRYGLRVQGPWEPDQGHLFDAAKLLVDPYATHVDGSFRYHPDLAKQGMPSAHLVPKCVARAPLPDVAPRTLAAPGLIYEVNVRALTRLHPDVPPAKRGTLAALAEPCIIAHLQSLGVDTVELMPVAAWIDERHLVHLGLENAWGYNPVSFFAVEPKIAPGGLEELRATVQALHAANINVVLDVVFNHSGESDALGPTLAFRGLDNASYYRLFHGAYVNDTGCGNTLALDRPHNVKLVLDALRHFVLQAGVDGFRFDLATVMGRSSAGFSASAPLLAAIGADPLLASRLLIAEPWDVGAGGYQLGQFPPAWLEWNDTFRDDVRRFWRGDAYGANALATRITGSSDAFAAKRRPSRGVNFVSAHDGFTLRDTVTYTEKNNAANGEDNRDGKTGEITWPGGNTSALLATLFLSRGTPMLTAGDELGRTQRGNNNAYAQDNATTWLDWANAESETLNTARGLSALRRQLAPFFADHFLTGQVQADGLPDAEWLSADGTAFDWSQPDAQVLVLVVSVGGRRLCLAFNRGATSTPLHVTARPGHMWQPRWNGALPPTCPTTGVAVYEEVKAP